ncbi:putative secreted lipase [Lachnellula occidentalis]|uniref:Putative secreted lipase n=1 Tax=Lachnellula occidentalis TaxID=215460 RepID=A0A8H8S7E9_9HELO|nr:putative secreted lipase [Lachnellula occidentalis]
MFLNLKVLFGLLPSLLLFASSSAGLAAGAPPIVRTNNGTIHGRADLAAGTCAYYDIPYAQAPVGSLRLQGPQPRTKPFEKSDFSNPSNNRCYGIGLETGSLVTGSEDCLYLDVIQPTVIPNKLMSVYVFIHGGDFNDGSKSENDGRNLVLSSIRNAIPIIYVSINYRLAFLGYPGGLEAGKHNAYNLGLFDQRM